MLAQDGQHRAQRRRGEREGDRDEGVHVPDGGEAADTATAATSGRDPRGDGEPPLRANRIAGSISKPARRNTKPRPTLAIRLISGVTSIPRPTGPITIPPRISSMTCGTRCPGSVPTRRGPAPTPQPRRRASQAVQDVHVASTQAEPVGLDGDAVAPRGLCLGPGASLPGTPAAGRWRVPVIGGLTPRGRRRPRPGDGSRARRTRSQLADLLEREVEEVRRRVGSARPAGPRGPRSRWSPVGVGTLPIRSSRSYRRSITWTAVDGWLIAGESACVATSTSCRIPKVGSW